MNAFRSSHDPAFATTIAEWIQSQGEALVMIRWPNAGGGKSFEFFQELTTFMARIDRLPQSTSLIVFRQPQLPIRGTIDEDLIRRAVELIPESTEYLITGLELVAYDGFSDHGNTAGESHDELVADLREPWQGRRVAVGRYPEWLYDSEDVVSAYVPDGLGAVRPAAY